MRIAIGCDHGGFHLKNVLVAKLAEQKHNVADYGAKTLEPSDDYPDFVLPVGQAIQAGRVDRGILICGCWFLYRIIPTG